MLDKLVGTWAIKGQGEGECTYEWMEGGFFLIQRGRLSAPDGDFTWTQVIGHERPARGLEAPEITGRLFTSLGELLTYTCEADDTSLTIWFGKKGSPNVYRCTFADDGNSVTGAWEWPGGGYDETMTRVNA